ISWAFEATPEGLKHTEEVPADAVLPTWSPRKFATFIIVVATIAAALFGYQFLRTRNAVSTQQGQAATESTSPVTQKSIAVLPFDNQNRDPDTDYLSDGIPESIINSLSQLPQLRVMARSTVFSYKGKDVDPRKI